MAELGLQSNLFELSPSQLDSGLARMFPALSPALLNLVKFQVGFSSSIADAYLQNLHQLVIWLGAVNILRQQL